MLIYPPVVYSVYVRRGENRNPASGAIPIPPPGRSPASRADSIIVPRGRAADREHEYKAVGEGGLIAHSDRRTRRRSPVYSQINQREFSIIAMPMRDGQHAPRHPRQTPRPCAAAHRTMKTKSQVVAPNQNHYPTEPLPLKLPVVVHFPLPLSPALLSPRPAACSSVVPLACAYLPSIAGNPRSFTHAARAALSGH